MPCVLSILAHPDDAEFLCAGTLIRLRQEHGFEVHIATMTPGDCGAADLGALEISRLRRNEGTRAAALIGATFHCLEERDLLVFYQETTLEKVTRLLRTVRPSIVLTHSPADYMLDHEMTSVITRAACFAAPITNFLEARDLGPVLPAIPYLFYCDPIDGKDALGNLIVPECFVPLSEEVMKTKTDMLTCHASQSAWLRKHHGMDQYTLSMRDFGSRRGRESGCEFAEGFRQHRGHGYPQDNVLDALLNRHA